MVHQHELGWSWFAFRRLWTGLLLGSALVILAFAAPQLIAQEAATTPALQPTDSEKLFLDRLMLAESGGDDEARNPRSTALGPYQFLSSTFLDVMNRNFPALTDGKTDAQILQLRTDTNVARDAALIYTRENAAFLIDRGMEVNAAHLRLAFLVGPTGAQRVIAAEPKMLVAQLLSASALEANPFMRAMTAGGLIERSAREAAGTNLVTVPATSRRPRFAGIRIRCTIGRASCRRWIALATNRQARAIAAEAKAAEAGKAKD